MELLLAETAEKELAEHLVGDALENVVSAFDGFGREICLQRAADISFQNIAGARRLVSSGTPFPDVSADIVVKFPGRVGKMDFLDD